MDALFTLVVAIAALVVIDLAAATLGTDSRDGFADDRLATWLR